MLEIWAKDWLAWNMLPTPSAPPMQQIEKKTARNLPSVALPSSDKPLDR
jgi:hypothetical protein